MIKFLDVAAGRGAAVIRRFVGFISIVVFFKRLWIAKHLHFGSG